MLPFYVEGGSLHTILATLALLRSAGSWWEPAHRLVLRLMSRANGCMTPTPSPGPPRRRLTLERGETGELCTGGYSVVLGHWNDEAKTVEAIDADGFMHTDDLAVVDANSYLSIVGRPKGHGHPRRREHLPA